MSGVIQGWHVPHDSPSPVEEFGILEVIDTHDDNGDTVFISVKYDVKDYNGGMSYVTVTEIVTTSSNISEQNILNHVQYMLEEKHGSDTDISYYHNAIKF